MDRRSDLHPRDSGQYVPGSTDIGNTPLALGLGPNQAAAGTVLSDYYNELLSADIASLNTGGVRIVVDDAFSLIDKAVATPGLFGLMNVTSSVYSGPSTSFVPADLVSTDPAVQNTFLFFDIGGCEFRRFRNSLYYMT